MVVTDILRNLMWDIWKILAFLWIELSLSYQRDISFAYINMKQISGYQNSKMCMIKVPTAVS